jgi:hypothetical protein
VPEIVGTLRLDQPWGSIVERLPAVWDRD